MNEWKEAVWLARYVLKRVRLGLLIGVIFNIILGVLLAKYIPVYFGAQTETQGFMIKWFDAVFLISAFGLNVLFMGRKFSTPAKTSKDIHYSAFTIFLNHLSIQKGSIIKHRMLLLNGVAISLHIILLCALYVFSETMRTIMDMPTYLIFSMLFISLGVFLLSFGAVYEIGYKKHYLHTFLYGMIGVLYMIVHDILTETLPFHGIINLLVDIANNYPIQSIIFAFTLAISSWVTTEAKMLKKIHHIDYL